MESGLRRFEEYESWFSTVQMALSLQETASPFGTKPGPKLTVYSELREEATKLRRWQRKIETSEPALKKMGSPSFSQRLPSSFLDPYIQTSSLRFQFFSFVTRLINGKSWWELYSVERTSMLCQLRRSFYVLATRRTNLCALVDVFVTSERIFLSLIDKLISTFVWWNSI